MKVLDLHCAHGHAFEGWFASEEDFRSQLVRGLVECPMCGDVQIRKALSAPRLNLRAAAQSPSAPLRGPMPGPAISAAGDAAQILSSSKALQAAWLRITRHVVAHTEDVGDGLAKEARRIHRGEAQERPIRGQVSVREAERLLDEGIGVLPLPLATAVKETLQ